MYPCIITLTKDNPIFRMIENNETETTEETKKHEKSSRPETNGTAAKPERETCSAQVPVSFVEQVKARVNSGGFLNNLDGKH